MKPKQSILGGNTPNTTIAIAIVILFIGFQTIAHLISSPSNNSNSNDYFQFSNKNSRMDRIYNIDASLSSPYLDRVNKFWHVLGDTQIRNKEFIRLTHDGNQYKHGIVLSNGIGDNTINNFEIIVDFKISNREGTKVEKKHSIGDGFAIMITPENDFANYDFNLPSERDKYKKKSGGIIGENKDLMGFPKNLPGLAILVDTYKDDTENKINAPFLDTILNLNPLEHSYDRNGDNSKTTSLKLNAKPIQLSRSILNGDLTKIRVIYMESIGFLKIDIQYKEEGNYWIELFQTNTDIFIPINPKTGQRYIGIGAMTGAMTENVDILNVQTNEFHMDKVDESKENSFDYAKEVQKYLANEYGQSIAFEMNEYKRLKMLKAQPNLQLQLQDDSTGSGLTFMTLFWRTIIFFVILIVGYLISVYVRISAKHVKSINKRRQQNFGVLPN